MLWDGESGWLESESDGNQTVQVTGSTTQVRFQEILKFLLRITSDSKELDKRMNQIRHWKKAGLKLAALSRCKLETSAFEGARGGVEGRLKAGVAFNAGQQGRRCK